MSRKGKTKKGVGPSRPNTFAGPSGGKTMKRCTNNGTTVNIEFIDIDDDEGDNVNKGLRVLGSDKKFHIPIIDLDGEVEVFDKNQPVSSVEIGSGFASDASSSSRFPHSSNKILNSSAEDDDDCQILHEILSPVKLSSKRTCAKAPSVNGYDLDSDGSDKVQLGTDYVEDTSGEIQASWEKANKRKKDGIISDKPVKDGQTTTSGATQKEDIGTNKNPAIQSKDRAHLKRGKCAGKDPGTSELINELIVKSQVEDLPRNSAGNEAETLSIGAARQEDTDLELHEEADGTIQDSLINYREMIKQTDAYKRAEEEEWASRQEALRVQAEEAQKMKQMLKRKKAESLRLLDMERRQKQRVEEIRETQKKDEENINMKEKLRAEVRMQLKQLEIKSFDMGSFLRGLGVHVGGGLHSQLHEIRIAYKKALLSFHPDRTPASDIRKLVESEEKFKLISRMKEKFCPTL